MRHSPCLHLPSQCAVFLSTSSDILRKRLLALAAQKFVSDIAADAYQHARIRSNAAGGRARANQPPTTARVRVPSFPDLPCSSRAIPRSTVTAHDFSERCNRHILVSPRTGQSPDHVDDGRFECGAGRVWYQLAQA